MADIPKITVVKKKVDKDFVKKFLIFYAIFILFLIVATPIATDTIIDMIEQHYIQIAKEYAPILAETEILPQVNSMISNQGCLSDLTYHVRYRPIKFGYDYKTVYVYCYLEDLTSESIGVLYAQGENTIKAGIISDSMNRFAVQFINANNEWKGPYQCGGAEIYLQASIWGVYSGSVNYKISGKDCHVYQFQNYGIPTLLIDDYTVYEDYVYIPEEKHSSGRKENLYTFYVPSPVYYNGEYYYDPEDLYDDWEEDFESYEDCEWFFDYGD